MVGLDAVVTVDATLLAMPQEPSRVSKAQDLSTYLSRRFNLTRTPPASSIFSLAREVVTEDILPVREVVIVDDPQVEEILPTQIETVGTVQPTPTVGTSVVPDVETFLANMVT